MNEIALKPFSWLWRSLEARLRSRSRSWSRSRS